MLVKENNILRIALNAIEIKARKPRILLKSQKPVLF